MGGGPQGHPSSGAAEVSSWPQGALEHSLKTTDGALLTDGKTKSWKRGGREGHSLGPLEVLLVAKSATEEVVTCFQSG